MGTWNVDSRISGRAVQMSDGLQLRAEERNGDGYEPSVGTLLSDVAPERVEWLCEGRIPRGKLTIGYQAKLRRIRLPDVTAKDKTAKTASQRGLTALAAFVSQKAIGNGGRCERSATARRPSSPRRTSGLS